MTKRDDKPVNLDASHAQHAERADMSGLRRLRETEANTPLLAKAQALLSAAPRLDESQVRMQRIRRELDRREQAAVGVFARLGRMPALAAAALIALFGASAFAAVRVFELVHEAPVSVATSASSATKATHVTRAAAPEVQAVLPVEGAPAGVAPTSSAKSTAPTNPTKSTAPMPRASRRAAVRAARVAAHAKAQAATASPDDASDGTLVHRALKALRRDDDPALALRLLDEDNARHPSGPLAEEALSLQIEAALALHQPRAATLAHNYLTRYPSGRYAQVAERALHGASAEQAKSANP